ncbi:MAG TPA: EamA family transporter, partial [Pontimonas sp.]|nr:EamA family transporter [Pontimonas sp.]
PTLVHMKSDLRWLPGFLALGLVWGSSFLFIDLALLSFSPAGVVFMRGLLGAASLALILLVRSDRLPSWGFHWVHIGVVALLLNAVPGFLFALGQQWVPSSLAGIVNATTPLMTVLVVAVAFRDQKPSANQLLGILVGIAGIILVTDVIGQFEGATVLGVAILLVATLSYGIAMPYAKRHVTNLPYSPYALAAAQVGLSALITLPGALVSGILVQPLSASALWGILGLGVLGTGIAYVWNYRNIELAGSVIASSVTYITPVVAVVLGVLFLRETLSFSQLLGGGLVILSALLVQERWMPIRNK